MSQAPSDVLLPHEAAHLEQILVSINARIARLAIALRVPLGSEAEIQRAFTSFLQVPPSSAEHGRGGGRDASARAPSPERRLGIWRSELCGLLVMRYETEVKLLETIGITLSIQVLESVAHDMVRKGFTAAAAGGALVTLKS